MPQIESLIIIFPRLFLFAEGNKVVTSLEIKNSENWKYFEKYRLVSDKRIRR